MFCFNKEPSIPIVYVFALKNVLNEKASTEYFSRCKATFYVFREISVECKHFVNILRFTGAIKDSFKMLLNVTQEYIKFSRTLL